MNRTKEKIAELNERITVRRRHWLDTLKISFDNELVQLLIVSLFDFAENFEIGLSDNGDKSIYVPGVNYNFKVIYGDDLEGLNNYKQAKEFSFNHTPYPCFINGLQMEIEENYLTSVLTRNGENYNNVLADIKDTITFILNNGTSLDKLPHLTPVLTIKINHESKIKINDKVESNENKKILFVFLGNVVLSRKDYQLGAMKGLHFMELSENDILQLSDYEKMDEFISLLRIKGKKEV